MLEKLNEYRKVFEAELVKAQAQVAVVDFMIEAEKKETRRECRHGDCRDWKWGSGATHWRKIIKGYQLCTSRFFDEAIAKIEANRQREIELAKQKAMQEQIVPFNRDIDNSLREAIAELQTQHNAKIAHMQQMFDAEKQSLCEAANDKKDRLCRNHHCNRRFRNQRGSRTTLFLNSASSLARGRKKCKHFWKTKC